jgi:hypothetical protein
MVVPLEALIVAELGDSLINIRVEPEKRETGDGRRETEHG